jgi:hypothetical protein
MERDLVSAVLSKITTDEKMTSCSRIKLQAAVLKLAPADMFAVPFAAMTTKKAIEIATTLVLDEWIKDEKCLRTYVDSVRAPVQWSEELEKRFESHTLTEAEVVAKYENKISNVSVCGQPFRQRDLKKEASKAFSKQVVAPRGFTPSPDYAGCAYFTRVPSSKIILGYKKDHLVIGSLEKASATVETSIRDGNYLDCEIVPCGAIVVTIGVRNELSGGLAKQESLTFRLDQNLALIPYSMTASEASEAEDEADKKIAGESDFDFAENSCPLSALCTFPSCDIIIGDKIIYSTTGTVKYLCGAPNNFWIVFVTGRAEHIVDSKVSETLRYTEKFFI